MIEKLNKFEWWNFVISKLWSSVPQYGDTWKVSYKNDSIIQDDLEGAIDELIRRYIDK